MSRRWRKVWIIPRRRKRGTTFEVVYYDPNRARRVYDQSFRTDRLAKEYARKLELYLNGSGPRPEICTPPPVEEPESADDGRPWTDETENWVNSGPIRPKTRESYRLMLRRFAELTDVELVEDVTEKTVSDFLAELTRKGRTSATTAGYLRVLAGMSYRSLKIE